MKTIQTTWKQLLVLSLCVFALANCSTDKDKNRAKESAAKYWQEKAYPGKAYDVQVIDAEKTDNGTFRVKGIVDGETRVGEFNPETENFSEGYYALSHERSKRIAELEQEVKYWKEKSENQDKEIYKLKVQLEMGGKGASTPSPSASAPATTQ